MTTIIVRDGSTYHRFTKDEKHKTITMESAKGLDGPWCDVPEFSLAQLRGYEGPSAFMIEPGAAGKPPVWGLLLDNYAESRGYQPFVSQNIGAGKPAEVFPFPSCSLTVLCCRYQRMN